VSTHVPFVRLLGGPSALQRALGIKSNIPTHWGRRGIPARLWHRIERLPLAVANGITAELLERTRPVLPQGSRAKSASQTLPRARHRSELQHGAHLRRVG
jgi:hypothetical protein